MSLARPSMPAIETAALTKRYGETTAVDQLDLAVSDGTIYGFLGPNGSGKTTTMRMLTGLTTPASGTATVAGVSVTDREALRPHIGYLPEEPPLYEQATAYEQLEYVAGLRDLPEQETQDRIDTLLNRLDLPSDDAATRIADYSKGMRQKVAYVQAVLHRPDIAFLDEPTSGLDPRAARTIRELTDEGTTVFLSTHISRWSRRSPTPSASSTRADSSPKTRPNNSHSAPRRRDPKSRGCLPRTHEY
jgi:ABC-2 type transport system ATP-binding protein